MTIDNHGHATALLDLTGGIVSAYVANNSVPATDVPLLFASVHAALQGLASGAPLARTKQEFQKATPSEIRKSVRHDGIVSFLDGRTYKTLKRHLSTHGLDPRSYRERYGLPADYPMVAPSYAEQRSQIARAIGLGRPNLLSSREARSRRSVT